MCHANRVRPSLVISREVGLSRVPGGSEDILLDLSVRELLKLWEKETIRPTKI